PGPLADKPVGDVKAARCQPAEPVEENAEERIGGHGEWSVASGEWSVSSAERVVPVDFPMNSSQLATRHPQLATHSRPLRQHLGLVAFDCVDPGRADGYFPGLAVMIPDRAEG